MPSPVESPTSPFDPLPSPYFLFFSVVEPLFTFAGAAYAIFTPLPYYVALYPASLLAPPNPKTTHVAATMVVRQLGSCFFLFALMGCVLLPAMRRMLKDRPAELETLVQAYLTCLAAADLTHIGFTLFDLGLEGSVAPSGWNALPHTYMHGDALARLQRDVKHGFETLDAMVQQTNLKLDALFSLIEDSCTPPLASMPSTMADMAHEAAGDELPMMPPLVDHEGRLYYFDGHVETPPAPNVMVASAAANVVKSSEPLPSCGYLGCIATEHSPVLQNAIEQPHTPAPQSNLEDAKMDGDMSDAETDDTLPAGSGEDADTETFDEPAPSSPKLSGWADDAWELSNVDQERFVYSGNPRRLTDRSRKSPPQKSRSGFRKPAQLSVAEHDDFCEDGSEEDPDVRINRIQIALLDAKLKLARKKLAIAQRGEAEAAESSMDEAED